jgi:hypothetical protein
MAGYDPMDMYGDAPESSSKATTPVQNKPAAPAEPAKPAPASAVKAQAPTPAVTEKPAVAEKAGEDTPPSAGDPETGPQDASGGPAQPVTKPVRADSQASKYARRRFFRNAVAIAAAVAVLGWATQFLGGSATQLTAPDNGRADATAQEPTTEQQKDAETVMRDLIADAGKFRTKHGTYRGFEADGVKVAANDDAIVIATWIDGTAWYTGILPNQDITVKADPTGQAMSDELIEKTQASLDQNETDNIKATVDVATGSLDKAIEGAQGFARRNIEGGAPSFNGMTDTYVDGVTIVANTGRAVILVAETDGQCVTSEVTATAASDPVATDCQ